MAWVEWSQVSVRLNDTSTCSKSFPDSALVKVAVQVLGGIPAEIRAVFAVVKASRDPLVVGVSLAVEVTRYRFLVITPDVINIANSSSVVLMPLFLSGLSTTFGFWCWWWFSTSTFLFAAFTTVEISNLLTFIRVNT